MRGDGGPGPGAYHPPVKVSGEEQVVPGEGAASDGWERIFGPPENAPRRPRRDDRFVALASGLDERGAAVGEVGSYRVRLLRGASGEAVLPGERVLARVQRRRGERIDAQVLERLSDSPERVAPNCPHTRDCGGCSFQELAYPAQLRAKHELALRQLAPLIALGLPAPGPPEPAPKVFGYRNKMDFTFGNRRWHERGETSASPVADAQAEALEPEEAFALGLHPRGRHDKVLNLSRCAIAFEGASELLESARRLAVRHGLAPWDTARQTGFLRHLVTRRAEATGEWLVLLVTADDDAQGFDTFVRDLLAEHPGIDTLIQGIHRGAAAAALIGEERLLHGSGGIRERLSGRSFRISAGSFFQTNTSQAEQLVQVLRNWAASLPAPRGVLYDLYCGGGALGLALEDLFDGLVGLELVESAVADAKANAAANGVRGARFLAGDVPRLLASPEAADLPPPGVLLLDPPRAGLHPKLPPQLAASPAPALFYVSCNLASAARDLALLAPTHRLVEARLVDLFPHTPHLEGLFRLERRSEPSTP